MKSTFTYSQKLRWRSLSRTYVAMIANCCCRRGVDYRGSSKSEILEAMVNKENYGSPVDQEMFVDLMEQCAVIEASAKEAIKRNIEITISKHVREKALAKEDRSVKSSP